MAALSAKTFLGTSKPRVAGTTAQAGRTRLAVVARAAKGKTSAKAAAMVCVDCGYIYDGKVPFNELPGSYACPVCGANKKRFKAFEGNVSRSNDNKTMASRRDKLREQLEASGEGVEEDLSFVLVTAASAAVFLGAVYYFTVFAR